MASPTPLEDLITLLNIDGKREAVAHCGRIVIQDDDFVELLLAGRTGTLGQYCYRRHCADLAPQTLQPTEQELRALARAEVGSTLNGGALKAMRKVDQLFVERRLLTAHLFYLPSLKYWHLFYFDQRDYAAKNNHWRHGPHLHYSRESFTRAPLAEVWGNVCQPQPVFPRSVHVRYDYHHNRRSPGHA